MIKEVIIQNSVCFEKDLETHHELLSNKIFKSNILIIGGAGSIGSSYTKQVIKYQPSKIVVIDINENGLTELTRDLRSSKLLDYNPLYFTYAVNLLSDTFDKIFKSEKWDCVANFSAHKHVRSEKDRFSIEALIKNNVFGAIKLLRLCEENPPNNFFSVSTDKATKPVNIMGASKSLMEKLILSMKYKFRVSTARFANVAFSNGSLLDGFKYRLEKQQPISCPNDIKRFFVTKKQSGQICLLASFLGNSGDIFFPKLDQNNQYYFKDIAKKFLINNDFQAVEVKSEKEAKFFDFKNNPKKYPLFLFKTDTSGEKPFEEFYSKDDNYEIGKYDSLGVIISEKTKLIFDDVIYDFEYVFNNPKTKKIDIIKVIQKYVSDFNHSETGKNLDQKM